MTLREISRNVTRVELSNKRDTDLIDKLKAFGVNPSRVPKQFSVFEFNYDFERTIKFLNFLRTI